MHAIKNKALADLARQLANSPKRHRLAQVRRLERVLAGVEPEKAYSFEGVCAQITGYRSDHPAGGRPIPAETLVVDLVTVAEFITRPAAIPVADLNRQFRTLDQLAADLEVSTKTIRRWRLRGLMGIRARQEGGVTCLVFLNETVKRFIRQNRSLVKRAAAFRPLTQDEKDHIVERARQILAHRNDRLYVVAREIAEQTGRTVETVCSTLRRFDQDFPDQALFVGDGRPRVPEHHVRIWRAFQNGDDVEALASAFECDTEAIERIIRQMRARDLKAQPIGSIYNELFDAPNADHLILSPPRPPAGPNGRKVRAPKGLPAYLTSLYDMPLMTAEQEADAFRRFNYLKYKAARQIESLDAESVTQAELDAVGVLIQRVESLRQEIVKANLRLVVSIAKRHADRSTDLFELISDGNLTLLQAVEKFDYARGFKFSTYASWAVMRSYARTRSDHQSRRARYVTGREDILHGAPDHRSTTEPNLDRPQLGRRLRESLRGLTERERKVVISHFGLNGAGGPRTLDEIGKECGVTRERVRQIERRAIEKLRSTLSPDLADLLPSWP